MIFKNIFSNALIAFSIMCSSITGTYAVDTEQSSSKVINYEQEPTLTISSNEYDDIVYLRAILSDHCGTEYGNVNFHYRKSNMQGRIESLHIRPDHRKKSFGSMLLTFALQTLTECKCTIVTWLASPFNLRDGENQRSMLPKLLAFYQKHGGIITQQRELTADIAFYPKFTS